MSHSSTANLLHKPKTSVWKSSKQSFSKIMLLGVAASISLLSSAAQAQSQLSSDLSPQTELSPQTDCYVEWTAGDRTSLENLCQTPAANPQSSRSQTRPSASPQSEAANRTQGSSTAIEVVSETGSAVYVNGVRISAEAQPSRVSLDQEQPNLSLPTDENIYFSYPQSNRSRRYVQYQRFYPSQRFYPYHRPEHKPQTERYPHRSRPELNPTTQF